MFGGRIEDGLNFEFGIWEMIECVLSLAREDMTLKDKWIRHTTRVI